MINKLFRIQSDPVSESVSKFMSICVSNWAMIVINRYKVAIKLIFLQFRIQNKLSDMSEFISLPSEPYESAHQSSNININRN